MQVFSSTVNQMLIMFAFISLGFLLNKTKVLPKETTSVIAKLETFVLGPCLALNNFSKNFTVENISKKWHYIVYSAVIVVVAYFLAIILTKFFEKDKYFKNIYIYSFTISNIGYMGQPVVLGVFGEEGLFEYLLFCIPLYAFIYSLGFAMLVPTTTKKGGWLKKFINPNFIAFGVGAVIGLLKIKLPSFLQGAISSAGNCMAPLAMILTGFIIANYSIKKLAGIKRIYIASVLRLVVIPLLFFGILTLLKIDSGVIRLTLCSMAMPLGLNTVVFPAAYDMDTSLGASMALVSNIMAVVTIPLMFLLI